MAGSVHVIGCSSGRDCDYFARRFPEVRVCGSDCGPAITTYCSSWWNAPNLSFRPINISDPEAAGSIAEDAVVSTGVSVFVDHPETFFRALPSNVHRVYVAEPISLRYYQRRATVSAPSGNFCWNHPFRRLLSESGWMVEREELSVGRGDSGQVSLLATRGAS